MLDQKFDNFDVAISGSIMQRAEFVIVVLIDAFGTPAGRDLLNESLHRLSIAVASELMNEKIVPVRFRRYHTCGE